MGGSDFSGGWVGCTVSGRTQPAASPTLANTAEDADRKVRFRRGGVHCGVRLLWSILSLISHLPVLISGHLPGRELN